MTEFPDYVRLCLIDQDERVRSSRVLGYVLLAVIGLILSGLMAALWYFALGGTV